ncbi:MAG: hypothetical protein ACKOJB_05445 [Chthoniobacterales bacterium]
MNKRLGTSIAPTRKGSNSGNNEFIALNLSFIDGLLHQLSLKFQTQMYPSCRFAALVHTL